MNENVRYYMPDLHGSNSYQIREFSINDKKAVRQMQMDAALLAEWKEKCENIVNWDPNEKKHFETTYFQVQKENSTGQVETLGQYRVETFKQLREAEKAGHKNIGNPFIWIVVSQPDGTTIRCEYLKESLERVTLYVQSHQEVAEKTQKSKTCGKAPNLLATADFSVDVSSVELTVEAQSCQIANNSKFTSTLNSDTHDCNTTSADTNVVIAHKALNNSKNYSKSNPPLLSFKVETLRSKTVSFLLSQLKAWFSSIVGLEGGTQFFASRKQRKTPNSNHSRTFSDTTNDTTDLSFCSKNRLSVSQ